MISSRDSRSTFANFLRIAQSDGEITQSELIFLQTMALKLGISPTEAAEIVKNTDRVPPVTPFNDQDRIDEFFGLCTMMNIDFEAHDDEKALLKRMGTQLRLPVNKVTEAIDFMADNVNKTVDKATFEAFFK